MNDLLFLDDKHKKLKIKNKIINTEILVNNRIKISFKNKPNGYNTYI